MVKSDFNPHDWFDDLTFARNLRRVDHYPNDSQEVTNFFILSGSQKTQETLHEFRLGYERLYGPTDRARPYSSQLRTSQQEKLLAQYPVQYVQNLPPFVKVYLKRNLQRLAASGNLDAVDEHTLFAYVTLQGKFS